MSLPPRGWVGGFLGWWWVQKGAAAKTLLAANSRAPAFTISATFLRNQPIQIENVKSRISYRLESTWNIQIKFWVYSVLTFHPFETAKFPHQRSDEDPECAFIYACVFTPKSQSNPIANIKVLWNNQVLCLFYLNLSQQCFHVWNFFPCSWYFCFLLLYLRIPDGPVMALEMAASGEKCGRGLERLKRGTKRGKLRHQVKNASSTKYKKKGIGMSRPAIKCP